VAMKLMPASFRAATTFSAAFLASVISTPY
jgi:hypothetical protein